MLHHSPPGSVGSSEKLSLHPVLLSLRLNKVVHIGASLVSQPSTFSPLQMSLGCWGVLNLHTHLEAMRLNQRVWSGAGHHSSSLCYPYRSQWGAEPHPHTASRSQIEAVLMEWSSQAPLPLPRAQLGIQSHLDQGRMWWWNGAHPHKWMWFAPVTFGVAYYTTVKNWSRIWTQPKVPWSTRKKK